MSQEAYFTRYPCQYIGKKIRILDTVNILTYIPRMDKRILHLNPVRKNIFEVRGGVCNTGFIIGEEEVIAVDAQMTAQSAEDMLNLIHDVTEKPVTKILLTHSDGDHINGLPGWPEDIGVICHKNTERDMIARGIFGSYMPAQVFSENLTILSGQLKIELHYYGPAHTDCDTVIFYPEAGVAFIGDLVFFNKEPLIKENGSSFGVLKALRGVLELKADIFLHGHGPAIGRIEIMDYITGMEEKQERIKELISQKKPLTEIKKIFYPEGEPPVKSGRKNLIEVIHGDIIRDI